MTLILSGTDGLSDIDGSASTPAIRGTDANTGIFFPAADTIAFSEGGAEAMRIDSSGNVGIGTSSPNYKFNVGSTSSVTSLQGVGLTLFTTGSLTSSTGGVLNFRPGNGTTTSDIYNLSMCAYDHSGDTNADGLSINAYDGISFCTGSNSRQERARIDSSGNFNVGRTVATTSNTVGCSVMPVGSIIIERDNDQLMSLNRLNGNGVGILFSRGAGNSVGNITLNTSSTAYNTSSDYRLKENVQPMTGALAKVAALKPCTYTWKADGSAGEGFIAHELAEIVPDAVTGEKDAVNEDGSIKPQGIDTSFLVATLTAAIQEQQQMIETLQAKVAALEAKG